MARTSPPYPLVACWTGLPAGARRELASGGGQEGPSTSSGGAATQPATLALGQPAPDAEALVVAQRVLQALGADLAAGADLLGLAGRATLLGEERLGVGLGAQGAVLPPLLLAVRTGQAGVEDARHAQRG